MRLKLLIGLSLLIICSNHANAQAIRVSFYNKAGRAVKTRDSADYISTIYEMDKATSLYDIKEEYANGKPKMIGKTYSATIPKLEGMCTTYYLSGIKRAEANYKQGMIDGDAYEYFPDGKLHAHILYRPRPVGMGNKFFQNELIMAFNDSTGKALVTEGNGYYVDNSSWPFIHVKSEGYLKNGLREGQWNGFKQDRDEKIVFQESYHEGRLISGSSTDKDGKEYHYTDTKQEIVPHFKGGQQNFDVFLHNNIVYPQKARQENIQGRVFISFTVEKDGTLTDIKIVRTPSPKLGAEALYVIQRSPKWEPGTFFGQPASMSFTVPINFTLSNAK